MNARVLMILLAGVLLNAFAQLALKAATRATGAIDFTTNGIVAALQTLSTSLSFWAALCAYGLSVLTWIVGLSRVPVSLAYPLLSLGYVVNAVAAFWLLGETLPPLRIAGIVTIIVGVYLVARG